MPRYESFVGLGGTAGTRLRVAPAHEESSGRLELNPHWALAKYDAANPAALCRLLARGAQLRAFSPALLDACLKHRSKSMRMSLHGDFKRVWESLLPSATRNTFGGRSPGTVTTHS